MKDYRETVRQDFDRIAELPPKKWNHNIHYHSFIFKNLPAVKERVLDVGCGTGLLSRQLSAHFSYVEGIDLAPGMIKVARQQQQSGDNISYREGDYLETAYPESYFDCITTVATVHHMDFSRFIRKAKSELKPGGTLLMVDLFEEETLLDAIFDKVAVPVSFLLKRYHNGWSKETEAARQAWMTHGENDRYLPLRTIRELAREHLPGVRVVQRLLWRYTLCWQKTT